MCIAQNNREGVKLLRLWLASNHTFVWYTIFFIFRSLLEIQLSRAAVNDQIYTELGKKIKKGTFQSYVTSENTFTVKNAFSWCFYYTQFYSTKIIPTWLHESCKIGQFSRSKLERACMATSNPTSTFMWKGFTIMTKVIITITMLMLWSHL